MTRAGTRPSGVVPLSGGLWRGGVLDRVPSSVPGLVQPLIVAIVLAVGLLTSARPAAAQAGHINSITPSCAGVGEQVTITGTGFGAKNVKITVGGVPAQVVSATGSKATFIVPAGVPPGSTTVTATNPGGQTGSIKFQVKGPEVCDGVDNDCNGQIDEGLGTLSCGVGVCARTVAACVSGKPGQCVPGTPTTEVCNGIDDNCNGQIDDGVGQPVTCGVGACARTVSTCANGQPQECVPGLPTAEVCGDGIDQDCNGSDLTCVTSLAISITDPPNLSSFNRPTIAVTGTVAAEAVEVTCNGRPAGINANGFGANVPLKEGSNIITCVAEDAKGNVGSASISVTLDSTPPRVTIDSPQDGATVTSTPVTVTGMVNDLVMGTVNGEEAGVKCNGVQAQVANRRFVAANVSLNPGPNTVTCIGEDRVGNVDTAHITVTLDTTAQAKISIVSGNNQSGGIGTLLPQPLVVGLTQNGAPAVGKVVVFKVLQNDGTLSANGQTARLLAVNTDANGQAAVQCTLGSWAGAGNNQVETMASGFVGEARFSASALPAGPNNIVVDAGNMQSGAVGQPLPKPFIAVVIDHGSNRLGGVLVMFRVLEGGGNFAGQSETTVASDSDGRVAAVLTLGADEGFDNNVVEATFPNNPGFAATFTASGKTVGDPADTKISGVVLDNSNNPIAGVTLQVEGISLTTQSDEQGQFLLQPAPVGHVKLIADGSTAPPRDGRPWPKLEYELVTIAGQNNTIGMPIYLLPIDEPNGLLVDETHGGTLTLPEVPGFALTIVPGSATFPDGSKRGTVSVTVVHADKVPMVPNFGQQPRFIITIQPAGTHFNPPAAMTLPNVDGLAPGQKTEMYSFDHDLGSFVSIGPATVSEDGTVVKSDPGVGVIKGGWHCGGNPSTTGSAGTCPECQKCQGNQCTPDNGRTCDDGKLCTSFSGTSIGPDQCAGGACKGSTIPDKDLVGITPLEFDLTALNQLIKGTAKAINLAPGCDVSDPSISGGIEISFFDRCCEPQGFLRGEKFSGFVTYNLAGVECIVPGLSVNLLNLVEVGIFVGIGASGTLSGGGDNGPCGHCNWSVGVNLGVTLSGGAKIITIQVPDFLDARLGIKGAGSINAESRCGNDSISGCAGPVTIFGEIVLAGFVKHNVDFTIPNSQICA